MLRRTVIKLSGEALGGDNEPYDDRVVGSVVGQIIRAAAAGTQIALVVGGGNLWRGRSRPSGMDRVKADQIGMLATVMNALYLAEAFRRQSAEARVMTPLPFANVTVPYERDAALACMAAGTIIISAAGLGHPFFSTDTVTALRAAELDADCVLYAKSVDGVYDVDPKNRRGARKYKTLSYQTAIAAGLNAADMAALQLSRETGIPSYVFGLNQPDAVMNACAYPNVGPLAGTYLDAEAEEDFYV